MVNRREFLGKLRIHKQPNAHVEIGYRSAIAAHTSTLDYRNRVRITLERAMAAPPEDYREHA